VEYYLTIDIGTTGTKVAVTQESGLILEKEYSDYSINSPKSGWAEQDCEEWWSTVCKSCNKIKRNSPDLMKKIKGVGICGQMHTHVYLDGKGNILRPAITWMDQRSADIVKLLNGDSNVKESIFKHTGNILTTTYTAPQVKWVLDYEPEVKDRTRHILIAKDYIKYLLTGEMVTDYSDASGTLLFDIINKRWSEEMFSLFNISKKMLPSVAASSDIIGVVTEKASKETGIPSGTVVVNGSSDNSAAALGAGMTLDKQATLIVGTAGVVSCCSDKPLPDPSYRTICWNYCLEDKWLVLGITQTAGESLNWFKNTFDADLKESDADIFQQYNDIIETVPDGCEGLVFLPYLNGERTPHWDPSARGVFFGISLFTPKEYFIKSIMEGVSFALRSCIDAVEDLGINIEEIRAVGGGVKSKIWLDILTKIIGKPLYTLENTDSGLIGNMLILRKAFNKNLDLTKETSSIIHLKKQDTATCSRNSALYDKQYRIFLNLYKNNKSLFKSLVNSNK
jgi:xylulokinase